MPEFIPGLQLAQDFYLEAVAPILARRFAGLPHAAALLGYGSEVLGLDDAVSRDHMWGPRLRLFLPEENFAERQAALHEALRAELPPFFRGYSVHFGAPNPADGGVRVPGDYAGGPVEHMVIIHTLRGFVEEELGFDPARAPEPADWVSFPEQNLLTLTAGAVFHDDLGLDDLRRRFAYYPREVWLYLLAAQWSLLSQQEAFAGRTAQVGDEIGSRLVTAQLCLHLMRLCFLMEKQYTPYSKWLGSAFQRLACAPRMTPLLEGAVDGRSYAEREPYLARAYSLAAELHNALGLTAPLETRTHAFSDWFAIVEGQTPNPAHLTRPFQVIFAGRFADALRAEIRDPLVLRLPPNFGSVNQFLTESSEARQSTWFQRQVARLLKTADG
jgi:hypothetical protein